MSILKVTRLNKDNLTGLVLTSDPAVRGKEFEQKLGEPGSPVDTTSTVDYPVFGLEVKTRKALSKSLHSIGSMTIDRIIDTPYENSPIAKKCQQQLRARFEGPQCVGASIYDFSNPECQEIIRNSYEGAREKIISGDRSESIKGNEDGGFYTNRSKHKIKKINNSRQFRLTDKAMRKLEILSKSTFNNLFNI